MMLGGILCRGTEDWWVGGVWDCVDSVARGSLSVCLRYYSSSIKQVVLASRLASLATFRGTRLKILQNLRKYRLFLLWNLSFESNSSFGLSGLPLQMIWTYNSSRVWKCHLNLAEEYEISTNTNQYRLLSWFIMRVSVCNFLGWRQAAWYIYLVLESVPSSAEYRISI